MPDALSKTVPIWCAVFNQLLFPESPVAHQLHTPPEIVSPSEHSQIEQRLDNFVKQLKDLALDVTALRKKLSKPMRPFWETQDSCSTTELADFPDCYPIVLCTASRRVPGGEISGGGYIQGAGDDSEGWSHGLTPRVFWHFKEQLLSTNEADLSKLIAQLSEFRPDDIVTSKTILIKPTNWLFAVSCQALRDAKVENCDVIITCGEALKMSSVPISRRQHIHLECRGYKLGSRDLRKQLHKLLIVFSGYPPPDRKVIVCCSSGKDLSVGVILAILCLYIDDNGKKKSCFIS
jgi:tRNA A64-2'-O-ribosylphosphate transferase